MALLALIVAVIAAIIVEWLFRRLSPDSSKCNVRVIVSVLFFLLMILFLWRENDILLPSPTPSLTPTSISAISDTPEALTPIAVTSTRASTSTSSPSPPLPSATSFVVPATNTPTLVPSPTTATSTTLTDTPQPTNTPLPATSTPVPGTPAPSTSTATPIPSTTDTPVPPPTNTPIPEQTDTPFPETNTPAPSPTSTPTIEPTPQLLTSVDDYSLRPNGVAENVIELSMDTLGIGTLNLTYPITMSLNQSSLVRLIIRPSEELVGLPQVAVSPRATNEPDFTYSVTDQIQLYPLMTANLDGNGFDIISDNLSTKPVVPSQETVWDWSVTPRETGNQSLLLTVSVPILMNDDWDVLQAQPLKSIPIDVSVEVTKTPIPTSTPKPPPTIQPTNTPTPTPTRTIPQQIVDNISNNATEFIGILLTFILGIPTAWILIARYRREVSKDEQKPTLSYDPNWTVKGVQEAVRKIQDVKTLESWLLKENQRNNPRKEALKAIRDRLREIKNNKSE